MHGSYSEVARVHGFPSATTIASYAKRRHGFDLQAVFDAKRLAVLAEYEARRGTDDPATHVDLARRHGVAVAPVYRARLRDELLNQEIFQTVKEADVIINQWRRYYNTERPHGGLGMRTPNDVLQQSMRSPATLRPNPTP